MIFVHLKIHVEQIKEIVTPMMNVRMAFCVDQIIVQTFLDFILNLIAVMPQPMEMNIFVHLEFLVEKMKVIVILMKSAKEIWFVDLLTVQLPLDWILKLIAVMIILIQLLEMKIFAQQLILVQ